MKRALSLFLSIIMVITAFGGSGLSVYAEEHQIIGEIKSGDSINLSLDNLEAGKPAYIAFTPDGDGAYSIYQNNTDFCIGISLYDFEFNEIDKSKYQISKTPSGNSYDNMQITYDDFTAGNTYYIRVYMSGYTTSTQPSPPSILTIEPHTHSFELTQSKRVTCVQDGYDVYTCTSCAKSEKRNMQSATGKHDFIRTTVKPTCVSGGYDSIRCRNCSYTGTENVVPADPNNHNIKETVTDPTCKAYGSIERKCTRKGCSYDETEWLAPVKDAHQFVNGKCRVCYDYDPSYVDETVDLSSQEEYICSGKYGGEELKFSFTPEKTAYYKFYAVSKTNRAYSVAAVIKCGDEVLYKSTSGELYICLELEQGREYQLVLTNGKADMQIGVSVSEHTHEMHITKEPVTCSTYGSTRYHCTNTHCAYDETKEYIEPTGAHQLNKTVQAPTCTSEGYTEYECANCDLYYLSDYIAPDSSRHNVSDGICTDCGAVVDKSNVRVLTLNSTVNTVITNDDTAIFVFTPEKTDYYRFLSSGVGIDSYGALFDALGNMIAFDDDSWTGNNFEIAHYLVAGQSYLLLVGAYSENGGSITVPITAGIHTHEMRAKTISAGCETKGYRTDSCQCGYEIVKSVMPASGHSYKKDSTVKPTCTEQGYTIYFCERCFNMYEADFTAPTGVHEYENGICQNCFERKHSSNVIFTGVLVEGERISVDYSSDDNVAVFTFTPAESGTYLFRVSGYCDSWAGLYDADGALLCEGEDALYNSDAVISYSLTAGKAYTYKVEQADSKKGSYFVSVEAHTHSYAVFAVPASCTQEGVTTYTCEQCYYQYTAVTNPTGVHSYEDGVCIHCGAIAESASFDTISENSTALVPMEIGTVLRFIPTKTKNYIISCKTDGNPQAAVLDENANVLYADDDGGENKDFLITASLTAGKCYYIAATGISKDYEISVFEENYCLHSYKCTQRIKPSCTKAGSETYTCTACGDSYTHPLAKTAHSYKTVKAQIGKNGTVKCSVCEKIKSTIYAPKTLTLSATSYTYNGKAKTPSVTVKDSKGKALKNGTDYTVSYANGRKTVGKYSVKVTFKGNYSGTKTLYFTIKPKNTSITSLTAGKKKLTVKIKKYTVQTTGYQIQYSTSSKFTSAKTISTKNTTTAKTISSLKSGKKYYVRIRTYKTVTVNGKSTKIYSSWSKAQAVKVK